MPDYDPRVIATGQDLGLEARDLARLRCPLTGQRLRPSDVAGELLTEDGRIGYPIIDGVICLTVASARDTTREAETDGLSNNDGRPRELDPVTKGLQRFYDEVGWQASEAGFQDAELFEDLRPVAAEYIRRCHLRVAELLPPSGELLLDAGSGPVQFPEYRTYDAGFRKRLCVDISLGASRQARDRLGARGIYVQADLARLPLADGSISAAVSLHTIYHVPAALQEKAFLELHRVLEPGGRAIVVYSWARSLGWRLAEAPVAIRRRLARLGRLARLVRGAPPEADQARDDGFYFHPHPVEWFTSRPWPFAFELAVWRFVSVPALKLYFHGLLGGRALLRLLFWAEGRWPGRLARYATYPLIVIDRSAAAEAGATEASVRGDAVALG